MIAFACAVIICSFAASSDALERGSPCINPNEETGVCRPLNSCTAIKDGIATRNRAAIQFAIKSQCGYDSEPLVCCRSAGNSENPTTTGTPNVITSFKHRLLPDTGVCGFQKFENKIWGGKATDIYEFPWIALLRFTDLDGDEADFRCGGSLVNNRYVVTAAHCVYENRGGLNVTGVRLGEWKISSSEDCLPDGECADPVVDVGVERIIIHNLYRRRTNENDIALIRLKRNVKYTDFIRPICIPSANTALPKLDSDLQVAGWGTTEKGENSDIKLKVKVPLVPHSTCAPKLSQRGNITEFQVCAGGDSGKDSCGGDSGGPLMRYVETDSVQSYQYFLEGIISWGVGCGNEGFPGVYVRVSKYADWITSNMVGF